MPVNVSTTRFTLVRQLVDADFRVSTATYAFNSLRTRYPNHRLGLLQAKKTGLPCKPSFLLVSALNYPVRRI